MEIKDRIKLVMEKENMPSGAFAESIGVQQSTLSHILNGRNNPSLDVIMKVHQRYTYLNIEWLLYGVGNMRNDIPSVSDGFSSSASSDFFPSLFDQTPENPSVGQEQSKNRKEMALESPENVTKSAVVQEIRYIEKPTRKITEIRIFFDDNTYETFRGEK